MGRDGMTTGRCGVAGAHARRAGVRPRRLATGILLLIQAAAALPALALSDDRDQPIYIQSDRAERDERKGTTVYTGDVEIDQGSLHISADTVTVHDTSDQISIIVANGNPAKMRQKPSPEREPIYARSRTIQYNASQEVLTLIEDASVVQEGTTVTGDRIVYYVQEQRVKATGNSSATGQERVKVVIPPRKADPPAGAQQQSPPPPGTQ